MQKRKAAQGHAEELQLPPWQLSEFSPSSFRLIRTAFIKTYCNSPGLYDIPFAEARSFR